MASPTEEPPSTDAHPHQYLEEWGFRSTRLNIRDLKAIAEEVKDGVQCWTCFVPETLAGPPHVRRRGLSQWTSDSLDGLIQVAPAGRIFHFEFEADVDGTKIKILVGAPWSKTHRSIVSACHGPGVESSAAYRRITDAVYPSAKRGRFWHYLSSIVGTTAIFAVAWIWSFFSGFFQSLGQDDSDTPVVAIQATVMTVFIILSFSPLWVDGFRRLTASSVKFKPNAVTHRAGSSVTRV
ncbi:hypothetical protein ACQP2E_04055 [Actinoplanes sp. CA-015351]|uniref:hypothetical protein n=1 Tax=Actinoplanes sp. CA-015351 TaxID=3239897 RepID=UPI003D986296